MSLDHVALTVADRERSARFYGSHFGLTVRRYEDGAHLILGAADGSVLALTAGDPVAHLLPAHNHFGFRAGSRDDVRAARERFRDAGVAELEWQDDAIVVRVQVADPDGYRVELYAW